MYVRTLHYTLADACPLYQMATEPVFWFGRTVSDCLPEALVTLVDRVVCAFEIALPKMATIVGAAAIAFYTGSPAAAMAAMGSLIWFAHDIADYLQFYPYDYLEDMSAVTAKADKESIVMRDDLLEKVSFYLSKKQANNNNVLVIGPAGCGKTSTATGLVNLIQSKECPPGLKDMKVYRVRLDKLMANVQRPGDFEMRFIMLLNALYFNKKVILFIDEAHQLLDKRGNGNTSLANLLKPFLSSGMRCLAATTKKEYEKHIVEDEGFEQRFNIIEIPALDKDTCTRILQRKFPGLTKSAALTAIAAAKRLHPQKALPRSAIVLLENTEHATNTTPDETAILNQVEFELNSLGSLSQRELTSSVSVA